MTQEKKTDRRVKRTRNAIKSAFIELLKKKDFESITINDIVSRIDISRGTFYLHYLDKYDLLEQMQAEFLENISQNLDAFSQKAKDKDLDEAEALKQYLHWLISMYEENADLMRLYLQMDGEFSLIDKLQKMLEENMVHSFYPSLDLNNSKIPTPYLNAYLFAGDMYIVIEWLKRGCVEPADDIVDYIITINSNGIFTTLNPPRGITRFPVKRNLYIQVIIMPTGYHHLCRTAQSNSFIFNCKY